MDLFFFLVILGMLLWDSLNLWYFWDSWDLRDLPSGKHPRNWQMRDRVLGYLGDLRDFWHLIWISGISFAFIDFLATYGTLDISFLSFLASFGFPLDLLYLKDYFGFLRFLGV